MAKVLVAVILQNGYRIQDSGMMNGDAYRHRTGSNVSGISSRSDEKRPVWSLLHSQIACLAYSCAFCRCHRLVDVCQILWKIHPLNRIFQ